jgi:transposase-like protein
MQQSRRDREVRMCYDREVVNAAAVEGARLPPCAHGGSATPKKDGRNRAGQQRYRCHTCRRTYTERTATPFAGYRWPMEIITMAVRWYCQFRLSLANVRDLLAERHIAVSARTILSWVRTFGPLFAQAVRRHARPLGRRWYCDETYVRVAGAWAYLYRAVDEAGQVVDVLMRAQRDLARAKAFQPTSTARSLPASFDVVFQSEGLQLTQSPPHCPWANGVAEHWIRSAHQECLDHLTHPERAAFVPGAQRVYAVLQ